MAIEKRVQIEVISSKCEHYKVGDKIFLDGAFIDKEKSADICMTALSALYPFIYATRKGVTGDEMGFPERIFQCPDGPETVEFQLSVVED